MTWRYRRSRKFGPLRFTFSRRGVSTSFGGRFLRFSAGSDGKIRRTEHVPGTGLYNTETVGQWRQQRRRR
jgi:hypothetical protein